MPDPSDASEQSPFAKAADLFGQVGNMGLHRNTGLNREEYLPGLRSGARASKVWAEMVNDSVVSATLSSIEMLLRRVEWNVECETSDTADTERAEFIESCMHDMSLPWEDLVADALGMLPYGFSYLEIVYKRRLGPDQKQASKRSDSSDGRIGWRKFVLIPQDTITDWQYDDEGGIQGAVQQTGWGGRVVIPIDKSLLFRTSKRDAWGRSVLRSAYLPWWFKKRIEEVEAIGVDRDLAGLPVMEVAAEILASPDRANEYRDIVRNIRRDEQEGVLLPQQWDDNGNPAVKLSLLTSGGARQFDIGAIVDRKDRHITMSLLQDVLMLGHTKTGTQALASEKRDLSDVALSTWLNEIAAVLNAHAVPRLLALNGMSLESPPKIVPGDLRQEDAQKWSEALKNVSQSGIDIGGPDDLEVLNFARRRLGMPLVDADVWEEAEALRLEQAEALREAQAQAAQRKPAPGEAPPEGTMPDGSQAPTDG
jgi:hypothetical protein